MNSHPPRYRLEELATSIDYGLTASATIAKIGPQFLRITDIQNDRVDWRSVPYCEASAKEEVAARLQVDDIVFARTGATTGKSFLLRTCPERAVFASYLIRVRPNQARVDPRYLFWYFQNPEYWRQIRSLASGTAQPGVNASKLRALSIPLPTLGEQRSIADILDKADAIRRKRKEAIALTQDLVRSAFLEMFGDIPAKRSRWPFIPLRPYLEAASGKSSKPVLSEGPTAFPVYGGNGVNGWATRALYQAPVVVVGRVGQQCGITRMTDGPAWVTDNAIVVSVTQPDVVNPVYLAAALQQSPLRDSVMRLDLPFINQGTILDYPLPLPPVALQQDYAQLQTRVLQARMNLDSSYDAATTLFDSLVHRAFSGDLVMS